MPYVNYDENNKITGIFANQQYEGQTFLEENSERYQAHLAKQEAEKQETLLKAQIDALDKKSIRAMREPSVKDATTDQTWLEYYTGEIQNLRAQIAELG